MLRTKIIIFFLLCVSVLNAQDKTIANVKLQGNKRLKVAFIKKIVKAKPGAVLDSLVLEEDIKILKRLPSVAHAYYQVFLSLEDTYSVVYSLEERFTTIPSVNFYTTNNNEFAYRLGLYEFNLLGRGISLGGFYQKDIFSSYGLNLRAPFLFTRQWGLAINHQDLTTQEPLYFNNSIANYKYRNKSYEVLGLYQPNFKHRFEAGVNYFLEDYKYLNGVISASVPQELSVNKMLYKGIYEYSNLDYNFYYVSGYKSTLNVQCVTSGGEYSPSFFIGWNDFQYYKRVGEKGNWASRLRLGLATNNETPFAPFSVDNNINIRGVGNTIDRGSGVVVLNTEYRYTLIDKGWFVLQGNAFVDAGTWRKPGGNFSDFAKSENIRIYPGLGVRFMHKRIFNAIFRLDYGIGVTNGETRGLVFGIGQYF